MCGAAYLILGGKAEEVVPQAQVRTFGETDAPGLFRNQVHTQICNAWRVS